MWLFFGISAILFTGFNLICSFKSKNEKWFRFAALSFTALTVCSFYSDGAMRVLNEDWGGLMDIMPTMSKALWVCVGISILLNSVSLFREKQPHFYLKDTTPSCTRQVCAFAVAYVEFEKLNANAL